MPHGWLGVSHLKGRGWGRAGSRQQSTFWAKRTAGAQALGCKEQVSLRKQKKSKVTEHVIDRHKDETREAGRAEI